MFKCLKNVGFDIKKVFLELECLNIGKLDNKFKFIVNFSWNFVSFFGVVNNSLFFYKKYVLDIIRMNDIFIKEVNVSLYNFDLLINFVVKNYDLYIFLNENNLEERILVVLKNIVIEVLKEIKVLLDDNIVYFDIEI